MFTGIIRAKARIAKNEKKDRSLFLTIKKPSSWRLKHGDSIAVDGVCLTVRRIKNGQMLFELTSETLRRTTFGKNTPAVVNLERPLRYAFWLDGHVISGHVDAIGQIKKMEKRGRSVHCVITYPTKFAHLVVSKGSIAVDGVSLTVVGNRRGQLSIALVDYTLRHATIGKKKVGDLVNLEFDLIAKYIYEGRRFPRTI